MSELRVTRAGLLALAASAAGAARAPRAFGDIRDDLSLLSSMLTIEYVQAALYRRALDRTPGLGDEVRATITTLHDHEVEHVDALRATIAGAGGRPREAPRVDFGEALDSADTFLRLATTLEDTGVSGLNGAAPGLENEDFVAAFSSIAQVEARHAAVIRVLRDRAPAPLPLDRASTRQAVQQRYGAYTVR